VETLLRKSISINYMNELSYCLNNRTLSLFSTWQAKQYWTIAACADLPPTQPSMNWQKWLFKGELQSVVRMLKFMRDTSCQLGIS